MLKPGKEVLPIEAETYVYYIYILPSLSDSKILESLPTGIALPLLFFYF